MSESYDPKEQDEIAEEFAKLLRTATKDGAVKRAKGEKVAWDVDTTHYERAQNHILRYEKGELVDKDSGAHPLVHAAWRFLAIAYQDTHADDDDFDYEEALKKVYY